MNEQRLLQLSVAVTFAFALFGVGWGLLTSSAMILFDGVYSLISMGLSLLSLLVLQQIQQADEDERFPFGKAHFEPLLVVFKSLTLIGMCAFSAFEALADLMAGGRDVSPSSAMLYALISSVGCVVVTLVIDRRNRRLSSGLLQAERNQWLGDSLLSIGVLVGFSVAFLLQGSAYSWLVPYADPLMLVVASSLFILLPLKSLVSAFKEVLQFRVGDKQLAPLRREAEAIAAELDAQFKLRTVSVGRNVTVELNLLMAHRTMTVRQMDEVRYRVADVASKIQPGYWVNVSFTHDPEWI
ncbi:cation diffusion facilitator family transporter [Ferrimonas sp. SCSIO 43195]|uniref:cation diffusion facilitator family transporter n=1 Tax=Ferrimonas sp. SCSIO 43195 TaxID=2822844 RepID=UPI002074C4A0|nr:cation transporter [Ferrimonas sp. SCSIO 43195]USD36710.1 cation transporter [Ferrimonas sp. SCSIO 43195]